MNRRTMIRLTAICVFLLALLGLAYACADSLDPPSISAPVHALVDEEFSYSFEAVENADSYEVTVLYRGLNGQGETTNRYEVNAPESRTTSYNRPGTVVIRVKARNASGDSSQVAERKVYIYSGEITQTVSLSTPYSETIYGTVMLNYEANGADDIRIYHKLKRETEWKEITYFDPNEHTQHNVNIQGIDQFKLEADFGDETVASEIITITRIFNEIGTLASPVIEVPAQAALGQDCTVVFYPVEYADSYDVRIVSNNGEYWETLLNETVIAEEAGNKWEYAIKGADLSRFGYNDLNHSVCVTVKPSSHLAQTKDASAEFLYGQKPVLSLSKDGVAPGDALSFTESLSSPDGSRICLTLRKAQYPVRIGANEVYYNKTDSYQVSFSSSASVTTAIDTSELEEGTYRLEDSCGAMVEFVVSSDSTDLAAPIVRIQEGADCDAEIGMYLPGADCFDYEINGKQYTAVHFQGDAKARYFGSETGETIKVRARGIRNGISGLWSDEQTYVIPPKSEESVLDDVTVTPESNTITEEDHYLIHIQNYMPEISGEVYFDYESVLRSYDGKGENYLITEAGDLAVTDYPYEPGQYRVHLVLYDDNGNERVFDLGTLTVSGMDVDSSLKPTIRVVEGTNERNRIVWFDAYLEDATMFEWRVDRDGDQKPVTGKIQQGQASSCIQSFEDGRAIFCMTDDPEQFLADPWLLIYREDLYENINTDRAIEIRGYANGAWSEWVSYAYQMPYTETLAEPVVQAPQEIALDEALTITWEPVEHAEHYYVLAYAYGWDSVGKDCCSGWLDSTATSYTIPAGTFESPMRYYIAVIATGTGYVENICDDDIYVQVCPLPPSVSMLSDSVSLGEEAEFQARMNVYELYWDGNNPVEYEYRLENPNGESGEVVNMAEGTPSGHVDYFAWDDLQFHIPSSEMRIPGTYKLYVRGKANGGWSAWAELSFEVADDSEILASGRCGENLTWILTTNGTLTISGTGAMNSYDYDNGSHDVESPWNQYKDIIKTLVVENGATTIGTYAFYNCTALEDISLPATLRNISECAFFGCASLTKAVIPEGVTIIRYDAFSRCTSLNEVSLPSTLSNWLEHVPFVSETPINIYFAKENPVFEFVDGVLFRKEGNILMWYPRWLDAEEYTVPEDCTGVYIQAFKGNTHLVTVTIPDSVREIGAWAFDGCTSLVTANMPSSLDRLYCINWQDGHTFTNCSSLVNVTIPEGIPSLSEMFEGCSALSELTIPGSVLQLNWGDFRGCTSLTRITIPSGVEISERNVFANSPDVTVYCYQGSPAHNYAVSNNIPFVLLDNPAGSACGDNLTWAIDAEGTMTISGTGDMWDFSTTDAPWHSQRDSIREIVLQDGVTSIGLMAFYDCNQLTAVTIPGSVTAIGAFAFRDCGALESVTIPSSVRNIGPYAFYQCDHLEEAIINAGIASLKDYVFSGCTALARVALPAGLTSIGHNTFGGCSSLEKVTLPRSLARIDWGAFSGCSSLREIVFPENVHTIEYLAFEGCTSLRKAVFYTRTGEGLMPGIFSVSDTLPDITIYCYSDSTAYEGFRDSGLTCVLLDAEYTFEAQLPAVVTAPPAAAFVTEERIPYQYDFCEVGDLYNLDYRNTPYAGDFISFFGLTGELTESVYTTDITSFAKSARVDAWYNADGSLREVKIEAEILDDPQGEDGNYFGYTFDPDGQLIHLQNEGGVIYAYDFDTESWVFVEQYEGMTAEEFEAMNGGPLEYLVNAPLNVSLNIQSIGNVALFDTTPDLKLPESTVIIEDGAFTGIQNKLIQISASTTSISDSAFDPSVVIICDPESYAKTWAEENGLAYIVER